MHPDCSKSRGAVELLQSRGVEFERRDYIARPLDAAELQSLSGMAALQYSRGRYLDARAFAERWLALAPADAAGLQLASQIELKLGDTAASARYLHQLQALPAGAANVPRTQ